MPGPTSGADPVLRVTRALAVLLVILSLGVLLLATLAFVGYRATTDDDDLAGLALLAGLVLAVIGLLDLPLALVAARAERPRLAFGTAIPAGVVGLAVVGVVTLYAQQAPGPVQVLSGLLWLAPFALAGCGVAGLVRSRTT